MCSSFPLPSCCGGCFTFLQKAVEYDAIFASCHETYVAFPVSLVTRTFGQAATRPLEKQTGAGAGLTIFTLHCRMVFSKFNLFAFLF